MRNIKIVFSYDGSGFAGYQKQPNKKTVQGELEKALSYLLKEKISVLAAGRTDKGVHALEQVANFHTKSKMPLNKQIKQLNNLLDDDIYIREIDVVDKDFKSPWDASSRTYIYKIKNLKDKTTFNARYYTFIEFIPNINELQKLFNQFLGEHNFAGFATKVDKDKPTIKKMEEIVVSKNNHNNHIEIEIKSDAFLRGMVRFIVGSALAILEKKLPENYIKENLSKPKIDMKRYKAPAQGLYLSRVEY